MAKNQSIQGKTFRGLNRFESKTSLLFTLVRIHKSMYFAQQMVLPSRQSRIVMQANRHICLLRNLLSCHINMKASPATMTNSNQSLAVRLWPRTAEDVVTGDLRLRRSLSKSLSSSDFTAWRYEEVGAIARHGTAPCLRSIARWWKANVGVRCRHGIGKQTFGCSGRAQRKRRWGWKKKE